MINSLIMIIGTMAICFAVPPGAKVENTPYSPASLRKIIEKLKPLHKPLGKPGPSDWLAQHREPGQTFEEYLECNPVKPTGKRRVIYIQPLGEFTSTQRRVVTLTADFMGRYFNLPVKIKEDLPLSVIPSEARRVHPSWGMKQILSTYVLSRVLKPRLPDDAAAYIAFTASDLWPGRGWNFVFGQASTSLRVGVWSISRYGNPDQSIGHFLLCLQRTLKVATHETGHMFSMQHCTRYACNMCGSNNLRENDRRPLALCPECLAKTCWVTKTNPVKRYKKLLEFYKEHGLIVQTEFCKQSLKVLEHDYPGRR
jgi:archaemetzincin